MEKSRSFYKNRPERRFHDRDLRVLDGTVKYHKEFHPIEILNLSTTGAYAIADFTPELTVRITLNIEFCSGSTMVTGFVRRIGLSSLALHRQGGFGIEFTNFFTSYGQENLNHHLKDQA
jgi:hypothetical protein